MCVARPIGRLGQRVKITGIRSVGGSADTLDWVFVKVEADQDRSRTDDFTPRLVGQNPTRVGRVSQTMRCRPVWRVGIVGMSAMSGMGQGRRDTPAEHKHSPVVELRGGRVRDQARKYRRPAGRQRVAVHDTRSKDDSSRLFSRPRRRESTSPSLRSARSSRKPGTP